VLPGKTIALPLLSAKSFRAGTYTASVSLKQGTLRSSVTKKVRVKRG
jgi:hypothetical protein